jgi:superfamily I DNA and/or RNA helicase
LCVAMSRQRRMLVAVGDQEMFSTTAAHDAVPGLVRFLELCGGEDAVVL